MHLLTATFDQFKCIHFFLFYLLIPDFWMAMCFILLLFFGCNYLCVWNRWHCELHEKASRSKFCVSAQWGGFGVFCRQLWGQCGGWVEVVTPAENILNHFCSRSSKPIICFLIHFNLSWNWGRLKFSPFMFCPLVSLFMLCSGFFSGEDSTQLAEFLKVSSALRESYRFAHSTDVGTGLKYGVDGEYVWHRAWRKQPFEKLRDYDQDLFAVRSSANLKRT